MDNPFISYYHFKKCADELRKIAEKEVKSNDLEVEYNFFENMFSTYNLPNEVMESLKLFYQKETIERVVAKIAGVLAEEFENKKHYKGEQIKELLTDLGINDSIY